MSTDGCSLLSSGSGCALCGKALKGRQYRWCSRTCARTYVANHRWTQAKAEAKKRVTYYQCQTCGGFFRTVEVNHKIPCKGKHGVFGCHHHQDNLEVLCKPCHKAETARQRENGEFK